MSIKQHINEVFESSFATQELKIDRYDTRPAPLNTILWTTNAESANGYHIGYYSLLDESQLIDYFYFPKNHELLTQYKYNSEVRKLIDLTNGWFALEPHKQGVIFNDLRFGQRTGWLDKEGDFVFSYYIYERNGEIKIEEVEKDLEEGSAIAGALWKRIKGIK